MLIRQNERGKFETVSEEGSQGIKKLEFFTPSINDSGLVAFRGIGDKGKRHIFLAGKKSIVSLMSEHQKVSLDKGPGVIFAPEGPSFGGGVTISNKNQVLVRARVFKIEGQLDLGRGLFRIHYPKE